MKKGVGGTLAMVGEGEGIVYSSYLKLVLLCLCVGNLSIVWESAKGCRRL